MRLSALSCLRWPGTDDPVRSGRGNRPRPYERTAPMAAIPAYLTYALKPLFGHQGFQGRFVPKIHLFNALLTKPDGRSLCV